MASTVRAAAKQLDWSKLTVSLPQETAASLQAFRKRNDEVKRLLSELKQQPTSVDFGHYRKVLKNQSIVDQAEKAVTGFKPVAYNLDAQLKAIDQFEAKAVSKAETTVKQIDAELKDLQATLSNIQDSRPIEQLTVDDIVVAKPEITKNIEDMLQKGKFTIPGYKEKFGDMSYF
ncbi:ATP synthase d subunit [Apophysomyces sp. BC1034]|nr:ATP synthase d subunit [Apophysomyces sp. BC1015]KAG0179144.1 ATP synthase d subunit [Apophysomyces sp. BC1021]KAG0189806.1 ATP synthase d subunit [Apophysomyces sp. BC1034]